MTDQAALRLRAQITGMRESAGERVWRHARHHCPHVPAIEVHALVLALGDISIDEAVAGLDRMEAERR